MKYIKVDGTSYDTTDYSAYLRQHAKNMPSGARAFALADWHYNIRHHQCPHDSWLEYFTVKELSSGSRSQIRSIVIGARFLGAYHDLTFDIEYRGVKSYSIIKETGDGPPGRQTEHGDWRIDEVTLTEDGDISHEILFMGYASWRITCTDLKYDFSSI